MSPPAHPDHIREQIAEFVTAVTRDTSTVNDFDPASEVWELVGPAVERVFRLDTAIAHASLSGSQDTAPDDAYLQALQDVLSDFAGLGSIQFASPAEFLLMVQSMVTQRGIDRLDKEKNPTEEGVTGDGR